MTLQQILRIAALVLFVLAAGLAFGWWGFADALGVACFGLAALTAASLP